MSKALGVILKYVHKFMHMHMYHEYESVYEYGSNAFELKSLPDSWELFMGIFLAYLFNTAEN